MKPYDWSAAKNSKLKAERLVSFEEIVTAIDEGGLLENIRHPNTVRYGHQSMYVVRVNNYVYLVPYVEDDEKIFLKTVIPSRKATRKHLKGEK